MNRPLALTLVTLVGALAVAVGPGWAAAGEAGSAAGQDIAGTWLGALDAGGVEIRVVFNITRQPDGTLTATMDSPDQGAKDIPTTKVTFADGSLRVEAEVIGGLYEGKMAEDGAKIEGEWRQSGMSLPLTLSRVEKMPEPNRPQEPKQPYPYREEEVAYENSQAGVKLAATLTYPESGGPFPAVVLITGSGPQDRNEFTFGHRPFLVLADYLTRRGIAVLCADDRGVGGSTGDWSQATAEDFAQDALAGVAYLKTRKEVDPARIGLIGHSEGGEVAPLAASQSPDVAFIVLMAGTGLTGEEVIYLQQERILKAQGASDETIALSRAESEAIFSAVKQEPDAAAAEKRIRETMAQLRAGYTEEERKALGLSGLSEAAAEARLEMELKQVQSPWFRYFLTYDPKPALMEVKCPVLAIGGEKDLQVPPKENLAAIEEALKAGGHTRYTIKELPGLNHLFQTAATGSPSEYMKTEETISPSALAVIGDWVLEQMGERAGRG